MNFNVCIRLLYFYNALHIRALSVFQGLVLFIRVDAVSGCEGSVHPGTEMRKGKYSVL